MNFGATTAMVEQRLQSLARVKTSLAASDLMLGSGSCAQGQACRKDVVSARAVVKGSPREGDDCGVTVGSAGDGHGVADVDGATLGIMHACEDEDGLVLPQVCAVARLCCVTEGHQQHGTYGYKFFTRICTVQHDQRIFLTCCESSVGEVL